MLYAIILISHVDLFCDVYDIDICDIDSNNIAIVLNDLIDQPTLVINNQQDKCVLEFMDLINKESNKDTNYIILIEKICQISDGFLSEYLLNIGFKQIFANFDNLIDYLNNHKNSCIERIVLKGIFYEINYYGYNRDKLIDYFKSKMQNERYGKNEKEVINRLIESI